MATQFEIDCALMAGRVYQTTRDKKNWLPIPQGWAEIEHVVKSRKLKGSASHYFWSSHATSLTH